ncbi:MAG: DUF3592 domain-containing protein, partial [Blastocatellia bacterium]|nr:DUF3592 domain-containing protein [Blastocatellia bacterium]
RMRIRGVRTTGTVVNYIPRERFLDKVVIQFEDQQGRLFEFTPTFALRYSLVRTEEQFVQTGEQFSIIYLPDIPQKAKTAAETDRRLLLPGLLFGLSAFVAGLLVLAGVQPARWPIGEFFIFYGLAVIVKMVQESRLAGRMRIRGVRTTGTVVNHVPREDSLDEFVIQFEDQQGRLFEFTPTSTLRYRFAPLGEQFPVIYLPDSPRDAKIAAEMNRRSLLPGLIFGLALFDIGLLVLTGLTPTKKGISSLAYPAFALASVIIGGLILTACLFPLVYSGRNIRRLFILHRNGVETTGTVTRTIKAEKGEGQPVIDFVDSKNRRIQFRGERPCSIATRVPVVYLPDKPHIAAVAPALRNVRSMFFLMLVGVLATTASVALFIHFF